MRPDLPRLDPMARPSCPGCLIDDGIGTSPATSGPGRPSQLAAAECLRASAGRDRISMNARALPWHQGFTWVAKIPISERKPSDGPAGSSDGLRRKRADARTSLWSLR
jgi:hypothetical protein